MLLFIFACLDHATSNAAQLRVRFPFGLSPAFAAIRHFAAFYALIPLVVAICLDRSVFKRGLADEPTVTLPAERQGQLGMITLALGHLRKPEFLRGLWSYVLQRRGFAWNKAVNPSDKSLPVDRARLVAMGAILEPMGRCLRRLSSRVLPRHQSRAVYQRILPPTLQRVFSSFCYSPFTLFCHWGFSIHSEVTECVRYANCFPHADLSPDSLHDMASRGSVQTGFGLSILRRQMERSGPDVVRIQSHDGNRRVSIQRDHFCCFASS